MTIDEVWNSAVQTFGGNNCVRLPNGSIKINMDGDLNNTLYIPENFAECTNFYTALPGGGGSEAGTANMGAWAEARNPVDGVVLRVTDCSDSLNGINRGLDFIQQQLGMNIKQTNMQVWSESSDTGFEKLNEILTKNPNMVGNLVNIDGNTHDIGSSMVNDCTALKERGNVYFVVTAHEEGNRSVQNKNLAGNLHDNTGINIGIVQSDDQFNHVLIKDEAYSDGVVGYLFEGKLEDIPEGYKVIGTYQDDGWVPIGSNNNANIVPVEQPQVEYISLKSPTIGLDWNKQTVPQSEANQGAESQLVNITHWVSGHRDRPEGGQINHITLHIVAGDMSIERLGSHFAQDTNRSSHYGVGSDGRIGQYVNEDQVAYTNGNESNLDSITIEIANLSGQTINGKYYQYPVTNEALDSTIRLVADIAKRNGIDELYYEAGGQGTLTWHSDYSNKDCPGDYIKDYTSYIMDCANQILKTGSYEPRPDLMPENFIQMTNMYSLIGLDPSSLTEGTVASDLNRVVAELNNVKYSISDNASIVAIQNPAMVSTTGVPAGLISCQTSLFSISSDLVNKIDRETALIANIAQTMYDMDRDLAERGEELAGDSVELTKELNKVLNENDITFDISYTNSFMFSPSAVLKSGSTKVSMSDINSMFDGTNLKGPLAENLANEKTCALNSKDAIDALIGTISGNANFQGSAWKAVESKLGTYSDLMKLRHDSAVKMEEATKKALKLIKDYMGEYEELDYSELDTLKQELAAVKQLIASLKHIMTATRQETRTRTYTDSNGNSYSHTYTVTVYVYSEAARAQASADLEAAEKQATEISKEIAKLEGLPDIIAQAEQIMNDAMSEIYADYGVKVSDTVTGKASSYIPPANTNYIKSDKVYEPEVFGEDKVKTGFTYQKGQGLRYIVSEETFNKRERLQEKWGSYEDYVAGVKYADNPDFHDDGVVPDNGEDYDVDTSILKDREVLTPETDTNIENNNEQYQENDSPVTSTPGMPSTGKPNSAPSQPSTPSTGGNTTPSNPGTPDTGENTTPSEPETPDAGEDTTPSEPETPDTGGDTTPSEPEKPDTEGDTTPSEPETPDTGEDTTPSEPEKPSTGETKPNKPEKPSISVRPSTKPNINENIPNIPTPDTGNDVETVVPGVDEITPELPPEEEVIPEVLPESPSIEEIPPITDIPNEEVPEDIIDIPAPKEEKDNSAAKAAATLAGVGAAIGAAGYAGYKYVKSKEEDEEDNKSKEEDY